MNIMVHNTKSFTKLLTFYDKLVMKHYLFKNDLVGQTKAKHTQSTVGFSGPRWHSRWTRIHYNATDGSAKGQLWSLTCTHRVCKAKFALLGPRCLVGEAKPRRNTRNSQLALQGSFGTAEGRETMTTTPESSLEVNNGP